MLHVHSLAVALLFVGTATAAFATTPPLSAEELTVCAQRVQQLRQQSPELLQRNADHDARRDEILARRRALDNTSMSRGKDDLEAGLEIRRQRNALNGDALALNREIQKLRDEISANSKVRDAYDSDCARRPYSRNALNQLPQAQQDAMRAGLADIQVPELPRDLKPLPGVDTP